MANTNYTFSKDEIANNKNIFSDQQKMALADLMKYKKDVVAKKEKR